MLTDRDDQVVRILRLHAARGGAGTISFVKQSARAQRGPDQIY